MPLFDFNHINDTQTLINYVNCLAVFCGFKLKSGIVRESFYDDLYMDHSPNVKFQCYVGSVTGGFDSSTFNRHKKDKYIRTTKYFDKKYGVLEPCFFQVRYRRRDPDDTNSNYILEWFNPFHNHPVQYEILFPNWLNKYNKESRKQPDYMDGETAIKTKCEPFKLKKEAEAEVTPRKCRLVQRSKFIDRSHIETDSD